MGCRPSVSPPPPIHSSRRSFPRPPWSQASKRSDLSRRTQTPRAGQVHRPALGLDVAVALRQAGGRPRAWPQPSGFRRSLQRRGGAARGHARLRFRPGGVRRAPAPPHRGGTRGRLAAGQAGADTPPQRPASASAAGAVRSCGQRQCRTAAGCQQLSARGRDTRRRSAITRRPSRRQFSPGLTRASVQRRRRRRRRRRSPACPCLGCCVRTRLPARPCGGGPVYLCHVT